MKARSLYEAGQLDEAVAALGAELRRDPLDVRRRTFLFELLCFAGEYDRAEKQLEVIARGSREADLGAWLYRSALHAERTRQEMFLDGALPQAPLVGAAAGGVLDGRHFHSLVDADPRIGARLEVFAAGQYMWVPFEQIAAVRIGEPQRLRDLLWITAQVQPGPEFEGGELGEVLLPALAPLSWRHPEGEVRLGRVTEWDELEGGDYAPIGQKILLLDGEPVPILMVRDLEISLTANSLSDQ